MNHTYQKECHVDLLTDEIEASAITIALSSIVVADGETTVNFKAVLPAGDKTILDALVTAHDASNYAAPIHPVIHTKFEKVEDDAHIPFVYASPRPMNHYSYFAGVGDGAGIGDGNRILFNMLDTDVSKTIDVSFVEDTYIKDGLIMAKGAPFGACVDIEVVHPIAGHMLYFGRKVPIFGDYPIAMNTEDRAALPAGLILRMTVYNSTGANGDDPAAAFKAMGRLELYRPHTTLGV